MFFLEALILEHNIYTLYTKLLYIIYSNLLSLAYICTKNMNMNTLLFYLTERALLNMESCTFHVNLFNMFLQKKYVRINFCLELYQ